MRNHPLLVLPLCLMLVTACDKSDESTTPVYIETGDLNMLQKRGRLRLLAPRFDEPQALPRDGIPVQHYQQIAEDFSISLGVDAQWVFVDAFSDLIPALEAGKGDLIVTNMTATDARKEHVSFSRAIDRIDEVVVGPKELELDDLSAMSDITIAVPEGTAYVESLAEYNKSSDTPIHFKTIPSTIGDSEALAGIGNRTYQATVIDSNIAELLVPDYQNLKIGAALKRNRDIAWAVRKNNPELLKALNEFLVAHFISSTTYKDERRDWAAIKQHGRLRMLTLNNPASYFMWRGDLMGFDYDLAKRFANQNKLYLSVIVKNSIPELLSALQNGEGDFAAASITKSGKREALDILFTRPYLRVKEQIIGRSDGPVINNVGQLAGMRVGVNPDTVFYTRLTELQKSGVELELVEYPTVLTEELFDFLIEGQFDFMIADSHLVAMELAHSDAIKINFDLDSESEIAWALRKNQKELAGAMNAFIKKNYRGLFYNVTFNKYFVYQEKIQSYQSERVTGGSSLSPYDDIVQEVADRYKMDWRLLTAQMYQESRFNPNAKSFAGAQGLMQVLPRTAKELGFIELSNPRNSIEAGAAYLDWLEDRFPGDINFQERIYFQLAAYNAGTGHVQDARRLAKKIGSDQDKWFDHVEDAMLLLSKRKYYRNARFGYVRGGEPVKYVKEIRDRYLAYLSAIEP